MKKIFLLIIALIAAVPLWAFIGFSKIWFYGKDIKLTDESYNSEYRVLAVNGDTCLIYMREMPHHYLKDLLIPRYDLVIEPQYAAMALKDTAVQKTTDIIGLLANLYTFYEFELNAKTGDGYSKKVREVAPHGYIKSWSYRSNSVGGIETNVKFYNASKKTIKYIDFYFTFTNAVGDPVYDRLTRKRTVVMSCMGPIEEGEFGSWGSDNDPIAYIYNADNGQLVKCVIKYMDGSSYTLIKELIFSEF